MSNLEALVFELKTNFKGNFDYCLPVLAGLQSCHGLKELVLNIAANFTSEYLVLDGFFEVLITNCPNITSLKIHGECGTIDMEDLCWIPQLKNLEEFTVSLKNPPKNGQ